MALTDSKQKRLAAMIREAADMQGFTQKELAMHGACTSTGNLSTALACKCRMSEAKWRGVCDMLGIDFDAVTSEEGTDMVKGEPKHETETKSEIRAEERGGMTLKQIIDVCDQGVYITIHAGGEISVSLTASKAERVLRQELLEAAVKRLTMDSDSLIVEVDDRCLC